MKKATEDLITLKADDKFIVDSPTKQVYSTWEVRSDQSLSRVRLFATPWIAARQAASHQKRKYGVHWFIQGTNGEVTIQFTLGSFFQGKKILISEM